MNNHLGRSKFQSVAAATADQKTLLGMLLDRLVADIRRAQTALASTDLASVHSNLVHAQDIVTELSNALDAAAFKGGSQLQSLYEYLESTLVNANTRKDSAEVSEALSVALQIQEMFSQAASKTL